MGDPLLGAELHTLGDPFPVILTTRQTSGTGMLAARGTNDDVLEYEWLSEGCERFRDQRQAREIGLIVLEEGKGVEP